MLPKINFILTGYAWNNPWYAKSTYHIFKNELQIYAAFTLLIAPSYE